MPGRGIEAAENAGACAVKMYSTAWPTHESGLAVTAMVKKPAFRRFIAASALRGASPLLLTQIVRVRAACSGSVNAARYRDASSAGTAQADTWAYSRKACITQLAALRESPLP